jgi:hypothetical protein
VSSAGYLARLLVLCALFAPVAAAAPAGTEPQRVWSLRVGGQGGVFYPTGGYQPIGTGTEVDLGFTLILSRVRCPFALRFAYAIGGNLASYPDTTARYNDGTPWPYGSVDVSVGSTASWTTLGVQWDPHPERTGAYAFLTAGEVDMSSSGVPDARDVVIPNPPSFPPDASAFCMIAGVGSHATFLKRKTLSVTAELEFRYGGKLDFVVTPAAASHYSGTTFPTERANITGWGVSIGASYAFRWGKEHG